MTAEEIQQLFAQQDQRVQSMLSQAMLQVMASLQTPYSQDVAAAYVQTTPQNFQLTEEELYEINGLHHLELQDEQMRQEYGEELDWMTEAERRSETQRSESLSHHGLSGLTSSHWTSRPHGLLPEARDDGFRTPGDEAVSVLMVSRRARRF